MFRMIRWYLSGGIFTISGTPSAQSATSEYTYQIIPINLNWMYRNCIYGTITVNASSLVAINPALIVSRFVKERITPIEYSVGNVVSGINVTWTENGNPIVEILWELDILGIILMVN